MNRTLEFDVAFENILNELLKILNLGMGAILLFDRFEKKLQIGANQNMSLSFLSFFLEDDVRKYLSRVEIKAKDNIFVINNPSDFFYEAKNLFLKEDIKYLLIAPVLKEDTVVGYLLLGSNIGGYSLGKFEREVIYSINLLLVNMTQMFIINKELNYSHNYLKLLINSATEYSISSGDIEGNLITWNQGAERMFGWTSEEVLGKMSPSKFFAEDDIYPLIFKKTIHFGENFEAELKMVRKNGDKFPVLLTVHPIKDVGNKIIGMTAIVKDLTEKKEFEEKLQKFSDQMKGERNQVPFLIGKSSELKSVYEHMQKVARTNLTVLMEGESGTGKELLAEAVHNFSSRKDGPFMAIDCGAIPETLIESELFGYEKGAFTGAVKRKEGYFELADKGTIFLDEIHNLPYQAQNKLLRFLQERKIQKLGGTGFKKVDVRILAATNASLEDLINMKKFRSDLYFRLNEFKIFLPPLRERKEDIIFLADKFLKEAAKEWNKNIKGFSSDSVKLILSYSWPGNVRELKNYIRQAVLMTDKDIIEPEHFPFYFSMKTPFNKQDNVNEKKDVLLNEKKAVLLNEKAISS
ncbi:MAG: sigma 54-interacting transcriptional regulator, partial [Thermodesulfobacteriota bacterium]|nr:sigma 54-interacting transcriptional regulator [Thermodesulfobacteriota bacterium]